MAEQSPSGGRIRFGAFEADLRSGELFNDGKRVALANQSFVALATLLERPGELVSREELRRRLWPDNRVVEFEQGLNAIINRLREALAAAPGGAGLIETLPRRGYRFAGTLHGEAAEQADAPRKRSVPHGYAYGLAALFAVAATGVVLLLTRNGRPEGDGPKVQPLTSLIGREVSPALTPNGERLLFAWDGDTDTRSHFDLYSKDMGSERLLRLTRNPATALHAAWAPSGAQIALARETDHDSGVYLITSTGGSERLLASASFLSEPFMQLNWSPDGRQVAYAALESDGWSHVHVVNTSDPEKLSGSEKPSDLGRSSGSERQQLKRPAACADAGLPAFSLDGRRLAFVCTSSVAVYEVYVTELASGAARSLASLQGNPQGLAWSPQGDALILVSESGADSGIWRITLAGKVSRLIRAEGSLGPGVAVADGHIAFVRENQTINIWRADLTAPTSANDNLISSTRTQLVPQHSPDGTRIAFESTRSGSPEIWLADADGGNPVKLTSFNGPLTGAPTWCTDGRRIAFDSRASGTSAIYLLDVLEGRPHRLETSVDNLALPVWSQDCRWIIASNGRSALYRVPASGGPAEQFTEKRAYRAVVSGASVIFNVAGESEVELWSKPVEGGVEAPIEGMVPLRYSDSWTATLSGIYYTNSSARSPTVNFYDFASRQTRVVRTLEGSPAALGGLGISVSKDEHWLLYTRAEKSEADIVMVSGP